MSEAASGNMIESPRRIPMLDSPRCDEIASVTKAPRFGIVKRRRAVLVSRDGILGLPARDIARADDHVNSVCNAKAQQQWDDDHVAEV